jgi:phosphosulfolactate synthase
VKKHQKQGTVHTQDYLRLIGVPDLPPRTSAFDPGYDPRTVQSHLEQSGSLMSALKISMACWQIADEAATRAKVHAARRHGVPTCTGGGPYEVAVQFGVLPQFLELCADIGVSRIEAGEGFTHSDMDPLAVVRAAAEFGLEVQYEVGEKHSGPFTDDVVRQLIDEGQRWLDAGAKQIVVEARESAAVVGLFDEQGKFNATHADSLADAFGLDILIFEAPTKASQFAVLNHFGPAVCLGNVRLEELLRVEIYRRGLHSDAFEHDNLKPGGPRSQ